MKILIAAPNRELLAGLKKSLELSGYESTRAFDGTQIIPKIIEDKIDAVLLDVELPRMNTDSITELFNEKNIPFILLCEKKNRIKDTEFFNDSFSVLEYPFEFREILDRLEKIVYYRKEADALCLGAEHISSTDFRLGGLFKVSSEEMNVILSINTGAGLSDSSVSYIRLLNRKLEKSKSKIRIKHVPGKGYTVSEQE